MAKVYAELIVKGKKTIDDVPGKLKDEVIRILKEWGYIIGGEG
jgi:hypothetical protein